MAGKTLIDGTAYKISGGKVNIYEKLTKLDLEYESIVLSDGESAVLYYADDIEVLSNGGAQFLGQVNSITVSFTNYDALSRLRGKYWAKWNTLMKNENGLNKYVHFSPSNAQYGQYKPSSSYNWLRIESNSLSPEPLSATYNISQGKAMIGGTVYNIKFKEKSFSDLFISMKAIGTVSGRNSSNNAAVTIVPTIGKYAILFVSQDILIYKIESASSLNKLFDSSSSTFATYSLKIESGTIKVYQTTFGNEVVANVYGATLACVEFSGYSDSEVRQILKNTSVVVKSGQNSQSKSTVTISKNKLNTSDIIIGAYGGYITVIKMGTTTLPIDNKNIVSGSYECLYTTESISNFRLKTATGTSITHLSVYGGTIIALREN